MIDRVRGIRGQIAGVQADIAARAHGDLLGHDAYGVSGDMDKDSGAGGEAVYGLGGHLRIAAAHGADAPDGVHQRDALVVAAPLHQRVIGLFVEYGLQAGNLALFHVQRFRVQRERGNLCADHIDANLRAGAVLRVQQDLGVAGADGGDHAGVVHGGDGFVCRAIADRLGRVGIQAIGEGIAVAGLHAHGTGMGVEVVLAREAHRREQQRSYNQYGDQCHQPAVGCLHGVKPLLSHHYSFYIIRDTGWTVN